MFGEVLHGVAMVLKTGNKRRVVEDLVNKFYRYPMVRSWRHVIEIAPMKHIVVILTSIAMVGASVASFSGDARADSGQIAAGILGGLAAGTILGAATAPRPYYYAPVYVEPVYVEPHCYWARGKPIWDDWRQAWVGSRVRVCD